MELLVLLRFGTFPFEEGAICGVASGLRSMEWSAFTFFKKERQQFGITSLNGVRMAYNWHKTQVRDTYEVGKLYFQLDSYLHNLFYDQ